MQEANVSRDDDFTMDEHLEPIVIGPISEVTGAAPSGQHDEFDNIVWGQE